MLPDKPAPPWAWRVLLTVILSMIWFAAQAVLYRYIPIPFLAVLWFLSGVALWLSMFSLIFFAEDYDFEFRDWHKVFDIGDDND